MKLGENIKMAWHSDEQKIQYYNFEISIKKLMLGMIAAITILLIYNSAYSNDTKTRNLSKSVLLQENTKYSENFNTQGNLTGNEFAATPAFYAGLNPASAESSDFNNDGKIDIAVVNKNGIVIFNKNNNGFANPLNTISMVIQWL